VCTTIWDPEARREITSPRELAALVGGLDNIAYATYGNTGPYRSGCSGLAWGDVYLWDRYADCCLCPVDIAETLKGTPYAAEHDVTGDWVVTRIAAPEAGA